MMDIRSLFFYTLILFLLKIQEVVLDKEYNPNEDNSKHFINGIHNPKYDSNVVLDSLNMEDDLTKITFAEKKKKLLNHLKFIDKNGDKLIDKDEISQFVLQYFQKQDFEDAKGKMSDADKNEDGMVGWDEYIGRVYGYTLDEIESFKDDNSLQMEYFLKMIKDDEGRFGVADQDGDGKLNITEYGAFLHSSNYPHMQEYEVNLTMKTIDKNNDGYINFDEYLGDSTPGEEQRIVDYENFLSYDTDGDKKLDHNEIKLWLLPDKKSISEEEAEHLIQETDGDGNGVLTFEEIINRLDIWLGSAATDYGQGLRVDHDEL